MCSCQHPFEFLVQRRFIGTVLRQSSCPEVVVRRSERIGSIVNHRSKAEVVPRRVECMSFEVREAVRKERRGIFRVVSTEFLIISHPPKIAENIVIRLHTAEQEGSAVAAQMRSATPLHQILSQQQMQTSGSAAIKKLIQLVKSALSDKMDKAGGTFTGNVSGKYFTGTWLQTLEATDLGRAPGKIAVLDESGWVYYRTPAELKSDIGASGGGVDVSTVLDKVYPVGSIYMSVNSTNPKTLFGGTWVQIKDRFLLAAGTTYKAGATGGEAAHTLTESEMPSHKHAVYYPNAGAADHSAPGNYPDGPSDSTYYAIGSYTSSAGGDKAHNNLPPYLSVYVWKRTA